MTTLTPSLPMYDWPELVNYHDEFWYEVRRLLCANGVRVQAKLHRSFSIHSLASRNFITQTCGYPLTYQLRNRVRIIGTPMYSVDHHENGYYKSVIVVRSNSTGNSLSDFVGKTVAINSLCSQSGCNALRMAISTSAHEIPFPYFAQSLVTGSHRQSLQCVAEGSADICAIDPVSWAIAKRFDKHTRLLKVIDVSPATPALPLVVSNSYQATSKPENDLTEPLETIINRCWKEAISTQSISSKQLLLEGITSIRKSAYYAIAKPDIKLF